MMRPLFRSLLSRNHEGHQCGEKHGAGAAGKVKLVAVGEWESNKKPLMFYCLYHTFMLNLGIVKQYSRGQQE